MSASKTMRGGDENGRRLKAEKKQPRGDYPVGFARTPDETRFKPGQSGNPKGRPKGARSHKRLVEEVFFEPFPVTEGDRNRSMPALQIVLKRLRNRAMKDDLKAALAVISIAQKEGLLTPDENEAIDESLSETDKAILENLKQRLNQPDPDTGGVGA
jgi:uncharacterized protein DUF5681